MKIMRELEELEADLQESKVDRRQEACFLLGKLETAEAADLLVKALKDIDPRVRGIARQSMERLSKAGIFPSKPADREKKTQDEFRGLTTRNDTATVEQDSPIKGVCLEALLKETRFSSDLPESRIQQSSLASRQPETEVFPIEEPSKISDSVSPEKPEKMVFGFFSRSHQGKPGILASCPLEKRKELLDALSKSLKPAVPESAIKNENSPPSGMEKPSRKPPTAPSLDPVRRFLLFPMEIGISEPIPLWNIILFIVSSLISYFLVVNPLLDRLFPI